MADADTLLRMYRNMVRIRACELAIAARYVDQEMRCPVHLCIGQEAIAAGVCAALRPTDQVFSGHRAHGHYLAKGGDMGRMMAELYGRATGCCGGRGGSMHLVDRAAGFMGSVPIVGSTIPIAVGAAFASKMRGEDKVTVVFFGDGATEEGVFHESLNFAALHRLPIVFVCEDNGFSVYSPMSVRRPAGQPLWQLGSIEDVDTCTVNGNDAIAVLDATERAVASARLSNDLGRPQFMVMETARWYEHCGPNVDDEVSFKRNSENNDPVGIMEKDPRFVIDDATALRVWVSASQEAGLALRFAKDSPFPAEAALGDGLA